MLNSCGMKVHQNWCIGMNPEKNKDGVGLMDKKLDLQGSCKAKMSLDLTQRACKPQKILSRKVVRVHLKRFPWRKCGPELSVIGAGSPTAVFGEMLRRDIESVN